MHKAVGIGASKAQGVNQLVQAPHRRLKVQAVAAALHPLLRVAGVAPVAVAAAVAAVAALHPLLGAMGVVTVAVIEAGN
jgi:hypothetical protein